MAVVPDIALRRRRFDAARSLLRSRVDQLESDHSLLLWLDGRAVDILSLLTTSPGSSLFLDAFQNGVSDLSSAVQKMRDTVEYLDRLALWERAGIAEFRPSPTVPGDLDLWVDPAKVPEAPEALRSATLGAIPVVLAIVGIIAATVGVGYGANVLIERERTERARLDRELAESILQARRDGTISPDESEAILGFVTEWKEKARLEAESDAGPLAQVSTIVKVAVFGALGLGLLNLVLSVRRPD